MAKKRSNKPTVSAVPPAPVTQEPEMAAAPLTAGFHVSPAVIPPEPEGFLSLPPNQAPLSVDQSDPTDPPLNQSEHTSSLEDGQGLIQTPSLEVIAPVAVTIPAAYSTHAGTPTKQAGKYYTPQPPSLR